MNSGIPNRAFALAARQLGGYVWNVLGRIWYRVMTGKLMPETSFTSFARDTVIVAGELYPKQGVQQTVADAWAAVGLPVPVKSRSRISLISHKPTTDDSHERRTNS